MREVIRVRVPRLHCPITPVPLLAGVVASNRCGVIQDTVEVDAGPGATHAGCSIIVDGQVVASHRTEGGLAKATCERGLRLGPS